MPDDSSSRPGPAGPAASSSNPLFYPTSRLPFSRTTFQNPPKEYRGAPFWGWVTKQELGKTVDQIDMFDKMGFGGFHMHTRVGLDIPYMGEEFMGIVEACVSKAKEKGMQACLYDEDRWPSGFAGGKVLEGHPEHKHLHLLWTPWQYGQAPDHAIPKNPVIANAAPVRSELGELLAAYAITLSATGHLVSHRRLSSPSDKVSSEETVWYAYVEPLPDSGFFGNQTYTDLLSADMTKRFIELTHEPYKASLKNDFGRTVPSMFTDEPQYCPASTLSQATGKQDVFLPWTRKITDAFKNRTGEDLVDLLPEMFYHKEIEPATTRYKFFDVVADLFAGNYVGVLGDWCEENGIAMTGHMNGEPTLNSVTAQTGDIMRCYMPMHIPGIDMLCDNFEYNTAKQATSVARQQGRKGVMSELYGVTGWQFTFAGHKGQGDWQAALGVTLRVPHLFWSTMLGEAKRDYPACIGYQSPWWKEYKTIEDHFARVNTAMTRGKTVTRVGVIHPIESFWLAFGPQDQSFEQVQWREKAHADLTEWLLFGNIDFDFICEALLEKTTPLDKVGQIFPVGVCEYEAIVVPNLRTIRSSTLERLQQFSAAGGLVIIAGQSPGLVDCKPAEVNVQGSEPVSWSKSAILKALEPMRDVDMTISESTLYRKLGYRSDSLIYQLRQEGDERWAYIVNIDRKEASPVTVKLRGQWSVEVLDTMSGGSYTLKSGVSAGWTQFSYYFDGCESLLVHLTPATSTDSHSTRAQIVLRKHFAQAADVKLRSVSLSEPNVLLLDYCSWQWNDEPWQPPEEVLRVDQGLRERFDFFRKGAKIPQPWTISEKERAASGTLKLQFQFRSDIQVTGAKLAIELPHTVKIVLDDNPLEGRPDGWWVDKDIQTIPLPPIEAGVHSLSLEYQYGPLTALERVYILGDFGVECTGRKTKLVAAKLEEMEFGDITRQRLPFYTGNLTYHCTFEAPGDKEVVLRVANFAGPTVSIDLDGKRVGLLVHEPYACHVGALTAGEHSVDFTCFGDRYNAFGALHLVEGKTDWLNADSWRSDFDWWSEEYVLGKIGILNAPRVETPGSEVPKQRRVGLHKLLH